MTVELKPTRRVKVLYAYDPPFIYDSEDVGVMCRVKYADQTEEDLEINFTSEEAAWMLYDYYENKLEVFPLEFEV